MTPEKLFSRGNISINLFNNNSQNDYGYKEKGIRFEWVKRLPFASFSYREFMNKSDELIDLTREYQKIEPLVKILGFNCPEAYLAANNLSGGQNDDALNNLLNNRDSYSFKNFSQRNYKRTTSPQLTLTSPKEKDNFMMCLSTKKENESLPRGMIPLLLQKISNGIAIVPKKRLSFYGQVLKPELFEAIVKKYHKPGLTHSLNHPYSLDNPLNLFLCKSFI